MNKLFAMMKFYNIFVDIILERELGAGDFDKMKYEYNSSVMHDSVTFVST
jgi:hypothetical protein